MMENVEGLLTSKGGTVVRELIDTLEELGYPVAEPWVLAAEQFGVPQMRRRVFLVAKRGAAVPAPTGIFDRCLGRRERSIDRGPNYPVTVSEAIYDLPVIAVGSHEPARSLPGRSAYSRWARGELTIADFLQHQRASA
ncbi:hypothetical protein CTI14_06400 [Methylobacterium radiotolerans]|nr:hypothetical protein CTI14_06400 [Methylobacterium radiotolerans]